MFIDTHTHLDGEEFAADRAEVMARAREAGVGKVFLPAIDIKSTEAILDVCRQYPGYAYPMVGLHPEEVRADWREVLAQMKQYLKPENRFIAIGEVGLDYYWSREFEQEQLDAFEEQVKWSVETRLPLMIHCRKGQNEMVQLLRRYKNDLPGGVFHCFTGNEHEAEELLQFDRFVIETDSPYMAPVPMRGQRNESAYVKFVLQRLAEAYGVSDDAVAEATNAAAKRIFPLAFAE